MLSQAQRTAILELSAKGASKHEIAQVLRVSRLTVRKVLRSNSTNVPEIQRVEKAELDLTAVIEPWARLSATDAEPERLEMYRFGVETMEEHQIRVLTTSDLGRVAETARRELRV